MKAAVCLAGLFLVLVGCREAKIGPCVWNLREIEFTKADWQHNERKTTNDIPSWEDLEPYFPPRWSKAIPVCPAGGTYKINRIGEPPTCSIGGPEHSSGRK